MINWIVALLVHFTLLVSVFDIQFRSPIVDNIPRQCEGKLEPLAKRLVIFITDGLRADLLYNVSSNKSKRVYFLRNIMEKEGSWGVSHTRIPTKSRPGVVAILGGFYEDPSSVLNLFDENPVEFDHVFNYVKTTFYFGYPGMPNFFSKSKSTEAWIQYKFNHLWKNLSKLTNSSTLDEWVFDHVGELFKSAKHNATLRNMLMQGQIIFCLHLAGMDLVSHRRKSITQDVIDNVNVIDEGVARVNKMFNEFYNDTDTVYILTSDHGMTDWGAHGGGTPDETETPFITWGAGIINDRTNQMIGTNPSPISWNAQNLTRKDIKQADAAPLISVLLGIPIPINSIGVLPLAYLNVNEENAAIAVSCNALELLAQSERTGKVIKSGLISSLHKADPLSESLNREYKNRIATLIMQENYTELLKVSKDLIDRSLQALNFYQNYYKNLLLTVLSIAFVGWNMVLLIKILSYKSINMKDIPQETNTGEIKDNCLTAPPIQTFYSSIKIKTTSFLDSYKLYYFFCDFICLLLLLVSSTIILIQNWPMQFHAYSTLSITLWWWVFRQANIWINCFTEFKKRQHIRIVIFALFCMCSSAFIIYSINKRKAILGAMIGIALVPIVTLHILSIDKLTSIIWIISSVAMIILPQYPIINMKPDIRLVTLAGYLWMCTNAVYIYYRRLENQARMCSIFNMFVTGLAVWNVVAVDNSLEKKQDLSELNYILSWFLLITVPLMPLFSSENPFDRLIHICLNLSVPFLLLSVRQEAITLYFLCTFLVSWVVLEVHVNSNKNIADNTISQSKMKNLEMDQLSVHDLRRGFLIYFYIILGFFAIGNIDQMATFDTNWVRCFVSEVSYFVMACLIVYKNGVVVMLTLCAMITIYHKADAKVDGIFTWFLYLNNIVGYYFFLIVQNDGTWKEISHSLAHHIFAQSLAIVSIVLYPVAKRCTGIKVFETFKTIKSKATEEYLKHIINTDV